MYTSVKKKHLSKSDFMQKQTCSTAYTFSYETVYSTYHVPFTF